MLIELLNQSVMEICSRTYRPKEGKSIYNLAGYGINRLNLTNKGESLVPDREFLSIVPR